MEGFGQYRQIAGLLVQGGEAKRELGIHPARQFLAVLLNMLMLAGDFRLISQHHRNGGGQADGRQHQTGCRAGMLVQQTVGEPHCCIRHSGQ